MSLTPFTPAVLGPNEDPLVHVLKFKASWCGPCRAYGPIFEAQAAADTDERVRYYDVDVDEEDKAVAPLGIRAVPTVLVVHQGRVLARLAGTQPPSELRQFVAQAVAKLAA